MAEQTQAEIRPQRINWAGERGLFLTDDDVSTVAGTLNTLADCFDFDVGDQLIADASALALCLVLALGGDA